MAGGANSQTHNLINLLNSKKMKTTYLKPTIDVLYISVEQMIAASGDPLLPGNGNNQNMDTAPTTDETSGNLARRKDIWADDEEDEEQF